MLDPIDRPLVRRTAELIHAIEDGRRVCERANLELLAAYERLEEWGPRLNAVIGASSSAADRAADGALHGVPVAVKDNIDVARRRDDERLDGRYAAAGRRDADGRRAAARGRRRASSARRTCSSTRQAASTPPTA